MTNPELNPHLTPEQITCIEYDTFGFSYGDYRVFDQMVADWNQEARKRREPIISVHALPQHTTRYYSRRYDLRRTPSRLAVYTLADPRQYDWKNPPSLRAPGSGMRASGTLRSPGKAQKRSRGASREAISKTPLWARAKPPRWYYNGGSSEAASLLDDDYSIRFEPSFPWEYKDGFICPAKRRWPKT